MFSYAPLSVNLQVYSDAYHIPDTVYHGHMKYVTNVDLNCVTSFFHEEKIANTKLPEI